MKVAVVVLALLVVFLADRTVRLENQRYALYLGLCKRDPNPLNLEPFWKCLEDVQTRTSWFWHLYYAVTDHIPAVSLF
jgi:hypothetical protein